MNDIWWVRIFIYIFRRVYIFESVIIVTKRGQTLTSFVTYSILSEKFSLIMNSQIFMNKRINFLILLFFFYSYYDNFDNLVILTIVALFFFLIVSR